MCVCVKVQWHTPVLPQSEVNVILMGSKLCLCSVARSIFISDMNRRLHHASDLNYLMCVIGEINLWRLKSYFIHIHQLLFYLYRVLFRESGSGAM